MALSAEERRQWKELERQLAAEDPKLARSVMDSELTGRVTRTAGTGSSPGLVLVAFALVLLAVLVKIPLIGVLGFGLMIMGGITFLRSRSKDRPLSWSDRASKDVS
ncbi:hypothetical protein MN0502_35410 (plasmid) [Arthrobacter sp. MN05-02]|nr:hypothetical protein MN0502_35410 [Arthrobacter sp. MN05-02]